MQFNCPRYCFSLTVFQNHKLNAELFIKASRQLFVASMDAIKFLTYKYSLMLSAVAHKICSIIAPVARKISIFQDAIKVFLVMGFEALKVKDYNRAEMIYRVIISVTVCHAFKLDALIGAAITRYKKEKRTLWWLNSCIKDMELPVMEDPWLPFEVRISIQM